MIKLKRGVDIRDIKPELMMGLIILDQVMGKHDADTVVTSVRDGKHGPKSLHRFGFACDVRSKVLWDPGTKRTVMQIFDDAAGEHFDLILEAEGEPNEHFHLEFDPVV